MAYGIEFWIDGTTRGLSSEGRLFRFHSEMALPDIGAVSSATYNVTGMVNDGTWVAFVIGENQLSGLWFGLYDSPHVTINAGSFTVSSIYPRRYLRAVIARC